MEHLDEIAELKDYFKKANIVVLAESGGHGRHLETIQAFINKFNHRLAGIFYELPIDFQPDVDRYLNSQVVTGNLEELFMGAAAEGKTVRKQTLSVFSAAARFGIRVICYDASKTLSAATPTKSKYGHYYIAGECRDDDMFRVVDTNITAKPGNYLVIIGADHIIRPVSDGPFENFGERLRKTYSSKAVFIRMATTSATASDALHDCFHETIVSVPR